MPFKEALEKLKEKVVNDNVLLNLINLLENRAKKIDYIRDFVVSRCYDEKIECCVHDLIYHDCDLLLEILDDNWKVAGNEQIRIRFKNV